MESSGARLKRIRQEKGLSLEEAQKKTKLQLNILQAIEGDSLSDINPAYLKGFIKIYCNYLGQDPKDFIAEPKAGALPRKESAPRAEQPRRAASVPSFSLDKALIRKFFYVLAGVLALFLAVQLVKFISSRKRAPVAAGVNAAAAPKITRKAVKPPARAAKSVPAAAQEIRSELNLVVFAREACLLKVKVDGQTMFNRVLEKGRSESWRALERIDLYAASAQAVELQLNTEHFKSLGRRGQPVNIVITRKEGLKILR
jgi:transcriptional regulator with XRE-family HTH domain